MDESCKPKSTNEELVHRFQYHPPVNDAAKLAHEAVRATARELAETLDRLLPPGQEKSLAVTKVEEAMFWANAAIARHRGSEGGTPASAG